MRRSAGLIALTSATVALLTLPLSGVAWADDSPTTTADQIASAVNAVAPPVTGADVPAVVAGDGSITAKTDTVAITMPTDSTGTVQVDSVTSPDDPTLSVGLPAGAEQKDAAVAGDGTVTYAAALPATDVAVQPLEGSVRIQTVLGGPEAPDEFSYPVDVPDGGALRIVDDGSVVELAADGSILGGFSTPWAKDANGNDVGTHFEVRGNSVVQVVEHGPNTAYPVVADPWLWKDLIQSASWVLHSEGWTLQVTPTSWARALAFYPQWSYDVGAAGWNELYSKYRNRGLNTNLSGMRDQYICHQVLVAVRAPRKATWNLDEWRPNVGWWQTVNSQCNPGGSKWFD